MSGTERKRKRRKVKSRTIVDMYVYVCTYLVITLKPIDGWESLDHDTWDVNLIGYGVHFNNGDIVIALQLCSKTVPDGS